MKTINISKLNNKIKTIKAVGMACMTLSVFFLSGCANKRDGLTITNVSYDPTREFYEEYNDIFADYYMNHYGKQIRVIQSHGGSGSQARSVVEGCNADVVTLALEHDITLIENTGLIAAGWKDEYDKDSAPYTSTIVFLVRKGNPFGIKDWDDLTAGGVEIITPDPKSSGGACWNFLAALSFAEEKYTDESSKKEFLRKLYSNVSVLDSGARGSTTTFVESSSGVAEGGRTGLSSVVTGFLFLIAIIFAPVFTTIPGFATAPALIFVGFLMVSAVVEIDFNDLTESIPAYLCLICMPLMYSISEGIAVGVISYVIVNLVAGKAKKITPLMYVLALLFILKYIFL